MLRSNSNFINTSTTSTTKAKMQERTLNTSYLVPNEKNMGANSCDRLIPGGQPNNIHLTPNFPPHKSLERKGSPPSNIKMKPGRTFLKPIGEGAGGTVLPPVIPSLGEINRSSSTLDESSLNIRNNNRVRHYNNMVQQHGDHAHNNISIGNGDNAMPRQFANGGEMSTVAMLETVAMGRRRLIRSSSTLNKTEKCLNIQSHYDKEGAHRLKRSVHTISPSIHPINRHNTSGDMINAKASHIRNTKSEMLPHHPHIPAQSNNSTNQHKANSPAAGNANTDSIENKSNSSINNNANEPLKPPKCDKCREHICYERRLQKLEAEIQRYKKEVKSFCRETLHSTNSSKHLLGHSKARRNMSPALVAKPMGSSVSQSDILGDRQCLDQQSILASNHAPAQKSYFQLLNKGTYHQTSSLQRKTSQQQTLPPTQQQELPPPELQSNLYYRPPQNQQVALMHLSSSHSMNAGNDNVRMQDKLPTSTSNPYMVDAQLRRRTCSMSRSILSKCA